MLGAFAMGGRGVVGSTYNYMAATYTRLIKAFEAGDMETALKEQRRSQMGVDLLKNGKYGDAVNVGKAMLELKVRCCCKKRKDKKKYDFSLSLLVRLRCFLSYACWLVFVWISTSRCSHSAFRTTHTHTHLCHTR